MILVTGSAGLIGRHLVVRLRETNPGVRELDLRADPAQDICDPRALDKALEGVTGVVHLAAVSRVAWAEQDPALCLRTNVTAVDRLFRACSADPARWVIFASSREVYGSGRIFPVAEDAPLRPINVYVRSKRDAELIVETAREAGMTANIARFANVYGCRRDYPDRVANAFAGIAARGGRMRVDGGESVFDFTAVGDVVEGLCRMIDATAAGRVLPPIHFTSGTGTSLRALAHMAAAQARRPVEIDERPALDFNVDGFVGDTTRAYELLGWRARTPLREGLARLVDDLAEHAQPAGCEE